MVIVFKGLNTPGFLGYLFYFACFFAVDGYLLHVLLLGSEAPTERDPVQEVGGG